MEDMQANEKFGNVQNEKPAEAPPVKSRFNEAEYNRWSEVLRNRNTSASTIAVREDRNHC